MHEDLEQHGKVAFKYSLEKEHNASKIHEMTPNTTQTERDAQ